MSTKHKHRHASWWNIWTAPITIPVGLFALMWLACFLGTLSTIVRWLT